MRCPNTARPSQFRGRARYRFAGVTFQCVLEAGHAGPCGMEPVYVEPGPPLTQTELAKVPERRWAPQIPEQIAASDARYRDMLRRRRAR